MKTNPRIYWAAWFLSAAFLAQGASLSFTNTTVLPPSSSPASVGIDLPGFDTGLGTLQGVRLSCYGIVQSLFNWNEPGGAGLVLWQTNNVLVMYAGSDVLDSRAAVFRSAGYPAPVNGSGQQIWASSLARKSFVFSLESDLANFTGAGAIPVSAQYYSLTVVTPSGPAGTWSLANEASVTVELAYDFAVIPEPGAAWLLGAGILAGVAGRRSGNRSPAARPHLGLSRS